MFPEHMSVNFLPFSFGKKMKKRKDWTMSFFQQKHLERSTACHFAIGPFHNSDGSGSVVMTGTSQLFRSPR